CEGCHAQEAANWAHTIHAAVFTLNPRDSVEAQGCEACHGPGSAHVKNPSDLSTIISFSHKSRTPVTRQNAQCLSCHQGGQRIFWHGSIHEDNNLACSDCHNPMSNFSAHGLTARESINQTCFSCHKVRSEEHTSELQSQSFPHDALPIFFAQEPDTGYAAERPMSLVPSGRPANFLARLDSRRQQSRL